MATPDAPEPPPKKLTLKHAEFERVNDPADATVSSGLEPMELLRVNRTHERKIGYLEKPVDPAKKSRRLREFWLLLLGGNLVFALFVLPFNFVIWVALALFYTAGLTWAIIFIMDDY
jgi:hypothetical protein